MIPVFKKQRKHILAMKALREDAGKPVATMMECPKCKESLEEKTLRQNRYVCPVCGYHHTIGAYFRLSLILDSGSFKELNENLISDNPLEFPNYVEKLEGLQGKHGMREAIVTATGRIHQQPVAVAVLDSRFFMGSMGLAVGEKLTRLVEHAMVNRLPLIIFSASGGARMQEGIFSLMQMGKTAAVLGRFAQKGQLFISVLTNPTTGGVTASFASLGDITLAEPEALIGFAGPRVIAQTIGQTLPDGFQRSEYLEEHGFVDGIVKRADLRETLSNLLMLHGKGGGK